MKLIWRRAGVIAAGWLAWGGARPALAHTVTGDAAHPHYDWSVKPPERVAVGVVRTVAQARAVDAGGAVATKASPEQAAAFLAFAPRVAVRWDEAFLYVESNGLPAHGVMVGITAWQQQVPLPQRYTGANAWRIPLRPVAAAEPASIKDRFLRGAIALAANGVPIFNPQNNRGEISAEIGELDQWGGHCGRADDYHYHAAPLHLQMTVGEGRPIAYALDGYAILGLSEPDGAKPAGLDAFNGHSTPALGYHYHASTKYPYVNGGFHGVVVERDGQVDPQPRAQPLRPALTPLRGAKITGFEGAPGQGPAKLSYTVNGKPAAIAYATSREDVWQFRFTNTDGATRDETYRAGERGGGGGGGGPPDGGKKGGKSGKQGAPKRVSSVQPPPAVLAPAATQPPANRSGTFALRSPAVAGDGVLPVEFTGDGESATPPLEWSGAPEGTKSFVLIMHHLDPEGATKWYWTLYNLPADTRSLAKNTTGLGTLGTNSVNRRPGYAPPHSKGPGAKTYVLTVYALAARLELPLSAAEVNRDVLLAAMKDITLDRAELNVTYTRLAGSHRDEAEPKAGKKSKGEKKA